MTPHRALLGTPGTEHDWSATGWAYPICVAAEAVNTNAKTIARETVTTTPTCNARDLEYAIALTLANAGNARRSQELADHLSHNFPDDSIVRFNYLPTLHGKIALLQGNPQEALHFLEIAGSYEVGLPANGLYNWPNLYPVYVRGEAYLAAHQGREAAAEFQKILDPRSSRHRAE